MTTEPLIVVMGLDPEKHKMSPLLTHHLKKMQKDFLISFDPEPPEKYQSAMKQTAFVPTPLKKVILTDDKKV